LVIDLLGHHRILVAFETQLECSIRAGDLEYFPLKLETQQAWGLRIFSFELGTQLALGLGMFSIGTLDAAGFGT
jgi:hypothetical protein